MSGSDLDDGFTDCAGLTNIFADAFCFRTAVHDVDRLYFDIEDFFNGDLDFSLVGASFDFERDLVICILLFHRLFSDDRADNDVSCI